MKPRLVIADPHASTREMLAVALGGPEGVAEVVGAAGRLEEAIPLARGGNAGMVLTSLGLPDVSGAAAVHRLQEALPGVRVLVHTGTEDRALLLAALAAGPTGLVHRAEGIAALQGAVAATGRGAGYFSPQVAGLRGPGRGGAGAGPQLSAREREVLILVAAGLSSKAAAARLGVSTRTVENHRAHLQRKLGLRGAAELTRFALGAAEFSGGEFGTAF